MRGLTKAETVNLGTTAADNAYGTVTAAEGTFNPALTTVGGKGIPMSNYNPALNTNFGRVGPGNFGAVNPSTTAATNQNLSMFTRPEGADLGGFTPEQSVGQAYGQAPDYSTIQKPLGSDTYAFKQSQLEQGMDLGQRAARAGNTLERGFKAAIDDPTEFFERMGGKEYDAAGNVTKEGSALSGGIRTALPVVGAAGEAYMRDAYEDTMVRPEEDRKRYYDPSRTLNLGMDTGLRLLAKGGRVNYEEGGVVRDRSYYGIEPQYTTVGYGRPGPFGSITPVNYAPSGPFDGGLVPIRARQPVQGFVDVGGKFKADPAGNITDMEYEDRFKYVTEGVKKPEDQDGDFDSLDPTKSGAGVNPAVALNLAQGYADSQQSDTAETGLGGLRKGGAIRYQQGGQTTAEMNTAKAATPPPATTMDMLIAKKNEEEMAKQGIPAGINIEAIKAQAANAGMAEGGLAGLTPDDGKMLNGDGDGVSDDIPAMIEGEQEAALSDGEFIVPARIVSELGNGSSDAGAQKLYSMIDRIQAARKQTIGDNKQYAKDTNAERFLPA